MKTNMFDNNIFVPEIPELVAMLKKGDEVPEWLLAQEPNNGQSQKMDFFCTCDIAVMLWNGNYFLMPADTSVSPLTARDGAHITMFSPSHRVIIPFNYQEISPNLGV